MTPFDDSEERHPQADERAPVDRRHPLPRAFFRSIRTRLAVCFSLVFVVVLLIVEVLGLKGLPFSTYSGRIAAQKAEAFRNLDLVADIKKDRLVRWLVERRADVHLSAASDLAEANVALLRAAVGSFSVPARESEFWDRVRRGRSYLALQEFMAIVQTAHGVYDRFFIADAETGVIFVSTRDADLGSVVAQHPCFLGTMRTGYDFVSDIEIDVEHDTSALYIGHVIDAIDVETLENREGQVAAVLMAEVNADHVLTPILHTGEGLGSTGEALLINGDMQILTSLKHKLSDGTTAPLEYQIRAEPAVLAARGEEGIIEAEDYRGEPVLAAYRHIRVAPEFGWGMVVKRDKTELFAPMRADVTYSALTGLFGIIVVVALTSVLARRLTGPIVSLSRTAERVAQGDLESRAPVRGSDEIGVLAATFNSMIERIQHWRREFEEAVTERTAELKQANIELETQITERRRAEEAVRAAQQQLLAQQRGETQRVQAELEKARARLITQTRLASIGQVAASIAHELRNPLGAARNATFYIKRYVASPESDLTEHLQIIDEEIDTADRIITNLMNMSRSRPPAKEQLDLGRIIGETVERIHLGDAIRCRVILNPDPFVLDADPDQLRQVLGNLLTNASHALDGHGEVIIEAKREKDCSEFMVRDNGPGVSAEHRVRLFEPLYTTKAKGTGLGLTICREIVERHGGSIELVDNGQPGAAFRIRLPQ